MFFFPSCNLREHLDHLNLDIKGKLPPNLFFKSIHFAFHPLIHPISLENRLTLPMLVSLQQISTPQQYLTAIRNIQGGKKNPKQYRFTMGRDYSNPPKYQEQNLTKTF